MSLLLFFILCSRLLNTNAQADASTSLITTPVTGPQNSSILNSVSSTFKITARDSANLNAGNSELFWVELYSQDSCEVGYGSVTCQVLCFPYNAPHIKAKQCGSGLNSFRVAKTAATALWAVANVVSIGSSIYDVTYFESVEASGYYIISAYLLTVGGLYARYWDNIWFSGSPSETTIVPDLNFHWGTEAITEYGTDYVSARFEGKLAPPYNETYHLYLYADDGARLWIDKSIIIDTYDQCCNESWGSVELNAETFHDIIIEYREIEDDAYLELRWSSDSIAKQIIPAMYFYSQSHIKDSPFENIYIAPGVVSYEHTQVNDVLPFSANIAGQNNSVLITATDAFGHLLESDTASWNITNLDESVFNSTSLWKGNGVYEITFMSNTRTVGTVFHIRLGNDDIMDSPFNVVIDPAATSPPDTILTGTGLTSAVAGHTAFFDITLYDEFGNERETGDDSILIRFYGAAAGHALCSYFTLGRGAYNCTYTLIIAGIYTPEITINNQVLSYSSAITVAAGNIHGPSCTVEAKNNEINAGEHEFVIIQSRDQFSNPLLGVGSNDYVVSVASTTNLNNVLDSNNNLDVTLQNLGNGLYNISFQPLISDIYTVNIKLDSTLQISNGETYDLTVSPNAISAINSFIDSGTGHLFAQSGIQAYFIVQLTDLYDNYLQTNEGSLFSTSDLVCDSVTVSVSCIYYQNGRYNCTYTPTLSGSCTLTVEISSTEIKNSPFSLTVKPGIINADNCYTIGISAVGTVGVDQFFTIQTQDGNGNNITEGGHTFNMYLVDIDPLTKLQNLPIEGTITDNNDGSYSVMYSTTVAGVYDKINIQLTQIGGLLANYYTDYYFTNVFVNGGSNIIDGTISFDWGSNSPAISNFPASDYFSVEWVGKLVPPYSETYTIYISTYGGSGVQFYLNNNLVIDQSDPLDGQSEPFVHLQLSANAMYDIALKFTEQTGDAKVTLKWQSASFPEKVVISSAFLYYVKDVGGGPYIANISILPSNTFVSNVIVSAPVSGLAQAMAGELNTLFITTFDYYNNIQTAAGDESARFVIYLIGDVNNDRVNGSVHAVNSGLDGLYTATYNVTDASQTYNIYITFDSQNIPNTPLSVFVYAGDVSIANSYAVLSNGRAGELQSFNLHLKDDYSNMLISATKGTANIAFLLTHEDTITTVTSLSIAEINSTASGTGIYVIEYNCTKSGTYTAQITVNSSNVIPASPAQGVNISDAIALASKSFVYGWENGTSSNINAGSDVVKTVQLADVYGNAISMEGGYNLYVTLYLANQPNSNFDHGHIESDTNGTYKIHFNATTAGVYLLNVKLASGDFQTADGLYGEYFNNRWLSGTPVIDGKIDNQINMNWNTSLITATAKDYVSIRWTGFIQPLYAELYTFQIVSDDGCRLYINEVLVFDNFLSDAGTFSGTFAFWRLLLLYPIRIEYRENTGNANISFSWSSLSQGTEIVPQSALFATAFHIQSSPFTVTAV